MVNWWLIINNYHMMAQLNLTDWVANLSTPNDQWVISAAQNHPTRVGAAAAPLSSKQTGTALHPAQWSHTSAWVPVPASALRHSGAHGCDLVVPPCTSGPRGFILKSNIFDSLYAGILYFTNINSIYTIIIFIEPPPYQRIFLPKIIAWTPWPPIWRHTDEGPGPHLQHLRVWTAPASSPECATSHRQRLESLRSACLMRSSGHALHVELSMRPRSSAKLGWRFQQTRFVRICIVLQSDTPKICLYSQPDSTGLNLHPCLFEKSCRD